MSWCTHAALGAALLSGPLGYLDMEGCNGTPTDTPPPFDTPTPFETLPPDTPTLAPTPTPTRAPTPTATRAPTPTATRAPTPTATRAPTPTATRAPTPTPTRAPTPTATRAPTPSEAPPTATRPPTPTPPPEVYAFNFTDAESLLYVQVFAADGSQGHDHVIRAIGYQGYIEYSPDDPSICAVDVSFSVEAMGVDEDYMRDLVGYDSHLSSAARSSIRSSMLAEDQLFSAMYPTISYVATGCERTANGMQVSGGLTIRGVTVNVPIELSLVEAPNHLEAAGSMVFQQSWFGFQPYKLFNFENSDFTTLTLDVIGIPLAP